MIRFPRPRLVYLSMLASLCALVSSIQVAIAENAAPVDRPIVWSVYFEAGVKAFEENRLGESEQLLKAALEQFRTFDRGDSCCSATLQSLVKLYEKQGRKSLVDYYSRVLAGGSFGVVPTGKVGISDEESMADKLVLEGRSSEAAEKYRAMQASADIATELRLSAKLAKLSNSLQQPWKAKEILLAAIGKHDALSESERSVPAVQLGIAELMATMADLEPSILESDALYNRSIQILSEVLGSEHNDVVAVKTRMANHHKSRPTPLPPTTLLQVPPEVNPPRESPKPVATDTRGIATPSFAPAPRIASAPGGGIFSPPPVSETIPQGSVSVPHRAGRGGIAVSPSIPSPIKEGVFKPDIRAYELEVQRQIKRSWFPADASSVATVAFKIHRMGEISHLKIESSSGSPLADQAALEAVIKAAPFTPLPDGAPDSLDFCTTLAGRAATSAQINAQAQASRTSNHATPTNKVISIHIEYVIPLGAAKDNNFEVYLDAMNARLSSKLGFSGKVAGTTVARFKVADSGEVSDLKLLRSSSDTNFDNAILRSIVESSPFLPLPGGVNGPVLINATFSSRL